MSQIKITLLIDIPEGARVLTPDVEYGESPRGMRMSEAEERQLSAPPYPDAPPPDLFAEAERIFVDKPPAATPTCPDHHLQMTFRPAGTSKRTGKPYRAFYGCPERDCKRTQNAA